MNSTIISNKYQFHLKFKSNEVFTQKNINSTFLAVLLTRLLVLTITLLNQFFFIEVEMLLIDLLKQFLKNMNTVKMWDKIFNKNLFTTEKEEENFRSSNTYWICEKLIEDEKVRDQDHITGRYRGTAHRSCNVNLNLAKKSFCNTL